jgi:C-terminal processing protease CtpA/Prc
MRVLAAVRIWGTLNWFHPYRPMIGEDWDAVLPEFIPKFEAARDATEYALAVAEMTTHVHDGHAIVRSDALEQWFGVAAPAVRVRFVEDQPVVVEFPGKTLPEGVSIGDVVVSVDGEPSKARAERLGKYMASSTPQALADYVGRRFLRGPTDSKAVLELRGASGAARRVELPRTPVDKAEGRHARGGDVVRILPGNIGYADLDRLLVKDVEPMFGALKDTDAIVFDMRGYPNSTASMIAPRLTARESPIAARFTCPILIDRGTATTPEPDTSEAFVFGQRLPPTKRPRYLRPTVMLIDGGTQSQAEHTGLFCEAANGTKFVGGPTAGANGDVTWFLVPGGISVAFSGQAVAHADGRPLQRVGLQPDVPAAPTIAGVRAGKDEVLDAALAYLAGVLKK